MCPNYNNKLRQWKRINVKIWYELIWWKEGSDDLLFIWRIGKQNLEVNEIWIGYSISYNYLLYQKKISVDFQKKVSTSYDYSKFLDIFMTSSKIDLEKNNVWSHCNPNLSDSANGPRESRQIDQNHKKPTNFITAPHRFYNIQSSNAKVSLVRIGISVFSLLGPFWTLCSLTNTQPSRQGAQHRPCEPKVLLQVDACTP